MLPGTDFWRGKRVLLTGHTGFKGAWLAIWLHRLGARVTGIALPPAAAPNLFEPARVAELLDSRMCDIRHAATLAPMVREARPEIVFHLAAQALVRASYAAPLDTFATNVMGTANLLDALRGQTQLRCAVVVSTDKVYRNREWVYPYREDDALGGHDPYSASKAAAELVLASYRDSFLAAGGSAVASARAGNVIGGGDWAQDRLIPDAVRAWSEGGELRLRHPGAVRPWQHVLEPLAGYLRLAERLWDRPELAGAYNFGPDTGTVATVGDVVELARAGYAQGRTVLEQRDDGPYEAAALALDISKARAMLGVAPRWKLPQALARTMHWYRRFARGDDARALCLADIAAFEAAP